MEVLFCREEAARSRSGATHSEEREKRGQPPAGRKEPDRMAVGSPELPQEFQSALGQGDVAVLTAFAVTEMNQHPGRIDVGNLQTEAFPEAQTAGVDGDETNP